MQAQAKNQTYLRMKNKGEIVALLREQSRSYSDIARVLNLSNTAVGKIAYDLIEKGLVKRENETKGRGGITLSINGDFGYVLVVDLSGKDLKVCAADFKSKILLRRSIPDVFSFGMSNFENIIETMQSMIRSEELKDRKLCCITVATPGQLNDTGEFLLNPRFRGFENISISKVMKEKFGCDVVVKNDVNLAMAGEKAYGTALCNAKNALMLHVDVGMGAALLLNGKVYEGSHGFAGEIGFFKLNAFSSDPDNIDNLSYSNLFDSVSLYSTLTLLRREVKRGAEGYLADALKREGVLPEELSLATMIEAYRARDPLTRKIVNASGRVIGTVAANLAEFLDVDTVLLNGAVIELGDAFLDVVSSYAKKQVRYSSLTKDATMMGAVDIALTQAFLNNF